MKRQFKKIFYIIFAFGVLFTVFAKTLSVNAAITIKKDKNDLGVVLYSLNTVDYYLEFDEEDNCAYVIEINNNERNVIGTCSVTIIVAEDQNAMLQYVDSNIDSSLGEIVIMLTDSETGEGYVQNVNGELSKLFNVNEKVIVNN